MISVRLQGKIIRIVCSNNQLLDIREIVSFYRTGIKLLEQNGSLPIVVDVGKNVKLTDGAKKIFNQLYSKNTDITLIIISG